MGADTPRAGFAHRHRKALLGGLILALILSAISLPFLPRDNSIKNMLPGNSGILDMLDFLHDARFAGQVALSFQRDEQTSPAQLTAAIDQFSNELDSPFVERIIDRIDVQSAGSDIAFFQQQLPALTDAAGMAALKQQLEPAAVGRALQGKYLDLLKPGGTLALPLIQRDPLNIQQNFLNRLQALASSSGYILELHNGYLFSADGTHALVVLETSAAITDMEASRTLLASIDAALVTLPSGVSVDIVCGHRHSVSNEAVLKRDVQRAILAAAIGFILLFSLCFRDHRAQFIFAIPLASVLLSIPICCGLTGSLSLFVLGFGVVIVGIAVDYGIHVYVALRTADDPVRAWRSVVRPVVLGALTTLGVFVAFFTAGVPGYSQMAVFSIVSILLSLLGAIFVLPHLIQTNPPRPAATPSLEGNENGSVKNPLLGGVPERRGGFFIVWLILLVALLVPVPRLLFDSDLQALDGSEQAVWDTEARFHDVWGRGAESLALIVVDAPDYETALSRNDTLYAAIQQSGATDEFSSFSSIWKSREHRTENRTRWQSFWTPDQIASLRSTIVKQGKPFGFKADAFAPFFRTLPVLSNVEGGETPILTEEPEGNQLFTDLKARFSQSLDGAYQFVSFFPDTDEWINRVRGVLGDSDALLISRREINRVLSVETVRTVKRVASAAVGLVVLFTILLMRRPREIILALIPAAVSVLAVVKILQLAGLSINIPTLISGIVVIGLSIDYGIFMVYGVKRGMLPSVYTAVTLSTLTSLIGAGVLLLTRHPALFSIGVTLVTGLIAGYVTALCAIPFLARFLLKEKNES